MGFLSQASAALQLAHREERGMEELAAMPPLQRERFRVICAMWAELAKPQARTKPGILTELLEGTGRQ